MKKTSEKKVEKSRNLHILKKELCEMIDKRAEDKIIEKENSDLIKKLINNASDEKEATMIATLGTLYKKTGFTFAPCLEKNDGKIKYFKKNEKLSFKQNDGKPTNKLIIGDNFDALNNLLIEYRNKIDVIYIDPPYGKDSMGEFAKTNYNNNITRDNLLSMLYPRLILAKQLLSDDGVIFCSIDDKNQAYVKCLFDEVFDEKNFCNTAFVLDNLKGKANDNFMASVGSKLIIYVKNKNVNSEIGFNEIENIYGETVEEKYKEEDEKGIFNPITFKKTGQSKLREDRPLMYYPILEKDGILYAIKDEEYEKIYDKEKKKFNDKYIKRLKEKYSKYNFILPLSSKGENLRWTSGFNTFKLKLNKDIFFDNNDVKQKKRPEAQEMLQIYASGTPKSFMYKPSYANGTEDLKSVLGSVDINFPKPIEFIKDIIRMIAKDDCTVLDFFAGSATTGHAVLALNKEDGGTRKFILCQLNEITDTTPNGVAYDVSTKRLKRVMTGKCYTKNTNFQWIKDNEALGGSLDVYNIESISSSEFEKGKTAFDVIDETVYGKNKIKKQSEKIAWVCENFAITQKTLKED